MSLKVNRRAFVSSAGSLALCVSMLPSHAANRDGVSVTGLRVDFIASPLGVESSKPRLSWLLLSHARNVRQTAYRVTVASSAEALAAGAADLWDSGRVSSSDCFSVVYGGAPLKSRQRCFWRARVWDEHGVASPPSETSFWEMGLLEPSDWSGKWLAAEEESMREDRAIGFDWIKGPGAKPNRATKFRRVFEIPAKANATFLLIANGATHAWLDGTELMSSSAVVGFGLGRAQQVSFPLEAGRHVLAVSVDVARIGERFGFEGAEMAAFLRVDPTDGHTLRFRAKGWKTALSETSGWNKTGFDDSDWSDAASVTAARPSPWPPEPAVLLRRPFVTSQQVHSARLYVTALGGYEIYLNGRKIGDGLLAPESNDFRVRTLYRVHDVTDAIATGENVLGAMVSDGWYASYARLGRYPWGPPPRRLLAQLELTYADGTREVIETGPGWQASLAPVVSSEIYDGETYDARLEQPGWASPGFDAGKWWSAWTASVPPAKPTAQIDPPIRREMTLPAQSVKKVGPAAFVFDFGQNFAGFARLKVRGPAGTRIEMRFAEITKDNGEVDQTNLRSARATEVYVLKGDPAGETYEPHFTYHGFRYVQVTGFPGEPAAENLEGVVIHSDLQFAGRLRIENPLIDKLWRNTVWSQRSNFMGIPTDCPQRDERLGWMGDANVFWDAAAFNMDVDSFTRRFMAAVRDAQMESGAFADYSPAAIQWAGADGKTGAAPGWADAGVCLPWTAWQRYGDTAIIDENWEAMTRYIRYILRANPDFVWRNGRGSDYGDWLALDAKQPGDPTTPKDLIGTAMWAHSVDCMAQMAQATNRQQDVAQYRKLWAQIVIAFQRNYVAADGFVGNGSQTGYILALRYNLLPTTLRTAAVSKLVSDIKRRGTLLSTGFLGTPNSLDVLADAGYSDLVYSLLLRNEFPSWGYMIAKGATTIWERWNGDTGDVAMNSFNHYALGAVCGFMFRRIAGIAPLAPGFRRIGVSTLLDPRVKHVGAEYDSVLGRISTDWRQRDGGRLDLDLTIPPNATATVHIPTTPGLQLKEGRRDVTRVPGIRRVRHADREAVLEVASGEYAFTVS